MLQKASSPLALLLHLDAALEAQRLRPVRAAEAVEEAEEPTLRMWQSDFVN